MSDKEEQQAQGSRGAENKEQEGQAPDEQVPSDQEQVEGNGGEARAKDHRVPQVRREIVHLPPDANDDDDGDEAATPFVQFPDDEVDLDITHARVKDMSPLLRFKKLKVCLSWTFCVCMCLCMCVCMCVCECVCMCVCMCERSVFFFLFSCFVSFARSVAQSSTSRECMYVEHRRCACART